MPDQTAIAFSVSQRAALMAWGAEQPLALGVRLTVDTEDVFEVAEIYHRDTGLALWMLFATNHGVILLSGTDSAEWKAESVKVALEKVLEQARGHGVWIEDWPLLGASPQPPPPSRNVSRWMGGRLQSPE